MLPSLGRGADGADWADGRHRRPRARSLPRCPTARSSPTSRGWTSTAGTAPSTRPPACRSRSSARRRPLTCRSRCGSPPSTASGSSRGVPAPACPAARPRRTAAWSISTERMTAIEVDPATRTAVVEPGRAQRRGEAGRRRARPLVPARPVVVRDLLDRRQRRHQRRRPVLREVRRHHRLRARPDRRARRRDRGRARRAAAQGRRRAVADQALRRQRGHPRDHHPRRAPAGPGACARRRPWSRRSPRSTPRPRPSSTSPGGCGPRCSSSWTGLDQRRRGPDPDGPRPRRRGDARDADRRARRAGRRGDRRDGRDLRRATVRPRSSTTDDPEEGAAFVAARRW